MKTLLLVPVLLGLAGCVAYGVPYGTTDIYYGNSTYYGGSQYYGGPVPYTIERPMHIYGGGGYSNDHRRGRHDRDHDGVPDRWDRDRDGDGVPNRHDAYPRNPRRR